MKPAAKVYTAIIMIFLFAPIAILLVFSFNEAKSLSVFSGFSLNWYRELFRDAETLGAVRNTLILAASAAIISTVMGTAAAVGINKLRSRALRTAMDTVTNIPMVNPDIITGISLMLMFVFVGRLFGAATSLNFATMLIAHVTFCLPYVILQVLPKLQQMDRSLPEAAMDLGCTPLRAFMKVEIPEIMPGRRDRSHHGLHPLAGRLRHQLLHLRQRLPDPADPHLQHDEKDRHAEDVRSGDDHLLRYPRAPHHDEPHRQ